MRILLVSSTFPPCQNAESILVARTSHELARLNHGVDILTTREEDSLGPKDPSILPSGTFPCTIYRTGSLERLLFGTKGIRRFARYLIQSFGIPEPQAFWVFSSILRGRSVIRRSGTDIIYSRASYHTSNIVGLALKKLTGLPWLAHFSDPWVDNKYLQLSPMQRRTCRLLEYHVVRDADAIVFVNPQMRDLIMAKYPRAWSARTHIIPHGFDTSLIARYGIRKREQPILRIVHVGTFYGPRTPAPLLHALALLQTRTSYSKDLRIDLVGENALTFTPLVRELNLQDVVDIRDRVQYHEGLQAMADADVLLLIDAPAEGGGIFLPSKLIDYLMYEKPILGITPTSGPAATILRRLEYPVVDPRDIEGICSVIDQLILLHKSHRLHASLNHKLVAGDFDNIATTRALSELLVATRCNGTKIPSSAN